MIIREYLNSLLSLVKSGIIYAAEAVQVLYGYIVLIQQREILKIYTNFLKV